MSRIKRIDRNHANASGDTVSLWRRQQLPAAARVSAVIKANSGITIRREVGFAGAAINYVGVARIDCQRSNIQDVLIVPAGLPRLAGIAAVPNAAARRAHPNAIRMFRMIDQARYSAADV